MTLSEYNNLKRQIALNVSDYARHHQLLNTLKELYKDKINSPRRFEKIKSIGELLHVLEIRSILSSDNLNPLIEISSRLPNKLELLNKINSYDESRSKAERTSDPDHDTSNAMQTESTPKIIEIQPFKCPWSMSTTKWKRVSETIVEEIGMFWKDLARNLKIRESDIDEIDKTSKNSTEKATKLLEIFKHKADPQRWFYDLCNALERARRRDLSKSLQEIMTMNL